MTTVVCKLPAGQEKWRPDPFPGGDDAFERGCTCPQFQPWPGELFFDTECPIHELDPIAPSSDDEAAA